MKHWIPSHSPETVTAAMLLLRVPPVDPSVTVAEVFERLAQQPELVAIPVVSGETPVGIVFRHRMIESFARPYTRELYGKKPVTQFMDSSPLIMEMDTDLYELSRLIAAPDSGRRHEGFILTEQGRYVGVGTSYDLVHTITERAQAQLYHLAHYDSLTGLPNRLLFMDRLAQAMAQANRDERLVSVMLLDLDRFKAINDAFGHSVGDLLLKHIAERLSGAMRTSDTIARLGGDEFTVMLPSARYIHDSATVAEKILGLFTAPFVMKGHEISLTPSIGIALYPFTENIDELLVNADTAMYRSKEQGGNAFHFYGAEMSTANLKRLSLETALRRALDKGEFALHYQPQVNLASGQLVGAEALLRWQHPEFGLVSPAEFIPLAEETGLILPIGQWVLQTACAQARVWRDAGLPPLRLAVNLSARQFFQMDFVRSVVEALAHSRIDPQLLEFELTEGALMQNTPGTIAILNELHGMGAQLAVDDFGTGYSSLSYLKRFPIDTVKIDRSFVNDITRDPDSAAITTAIVAMCHSLGISTIAEGVETPEQLEFLRRHGCDEVQGYLVSRPLPAEVFARFLAERAKAGGAQQPG